MPSWADLAATWLPLAVNLAALAAVLACAVADRAGARRDRRRPREAPLWPWRPAVIAVEGLIGAGKSTLLAGVAAHLPPDEVAIVPEPVDLWRALPPAERVSEDGAAGAAAAAAGGGENLLAAYYADRTQAAAFQMVALASRADGVRAAARSGARFVLTERSVGGDGCFADALLAPAWHAAYGYVRRVLGRDGDLDADGFVHLAVGPAEAQDRIAARGRPEEAGLELSFQVALAQRLAAWLARVDRPVMTVTADQWREAGKDPESMAALAERVAAFADRCAAARDKAHERGDDDSEDGRSG